MSTKTFKIDPHLSNFIKSIILTEMNIPKASPSPSYLYKEQLMKIIQNAVFGQIDNIQTQSDLEHSIDLEISNLDQELEKTLDMIGRTLKMVPLEVLKKQVVKK